MFYISVPLIIIILTVIISRVIFRFITSDYKTIIGEIVDFNTQKKHLENSTGYTHNPIIEFYVDGHTYRCVKKSLYYSSESSWQRSLIKGCFHTHAKVRYNPTNPSMNYSLFSIKDLKYNFIALIPILATILIMSLYSLTYS